MIFKNILEKLFDKITLNWNFMRFNSPSTKISNKYRATIKSNTNAVRTQIGQVIQYGLSSSEVKEIIEGVLRQNLMVCEMRAKEIYDKRIQEFEKQLIDKFNKIPQDEIIKLNEPDMQVALLEASRISGRKKEFELREMLANLVVGRIKNDKSGREELKNIVYNEAITTTGKLTIDQLKILALCFILNYTRYSEIKSWETFDNFLNIKIKPFLEFKNTVSEFQHIEYSGCGSLSNIRKIDLIKTLRDTYSFLFTIPLHLDVIDSLEIPPNLRKEIIIKIDKIDRFIIKGTNKNELEKFLKEHSHNEKLNKRILENYKLINLESVKEKIIEKTMIGKELVDIWDNSLLNRLSLKSVGLLIAITYFEQVTGEKIDIDIWIN